MHPSAHLELQPERFDGIAEALRQLYRVEGTGDFAELLGQIDNAVATATKRPERPWPAQLFQSGKGRCR